MAGSPTRLWVKVLTEDEWPRLRAIRLSALRDDPLAFMATYELESAYGEQQWRSEFSRGEWNVMLANDQAIGVVGATWEGDRPYHERHLEFLWIEPGSRRLGVATMLLRTVLDRLRDAGVRTVWLWILNGNFPARALYEQFGFLSTDEREPLPGHPAGSEEHMKLRLS